MPKDNEDMQEDQSDPVLLGSNGGGIERELFGKWTVLLRNAGGFFAVFVVCVMGLANCYTTFVSVSDHKEWPSEMSVFIMVVGPVICSWTFMNSSKTISTIMEIKGVGNKIRNRLANALATEDVVKQPKQDQ